MIQILVTTAAYAFVAFSHSVISFPDELNSREIDSWKTTVLQAPSTIVKSQLTVFDKNGEILKKQVQWHFKNGYVEESTTPSGAVSVYLANEKYSAQLLKNEEGYSISSLHLINQRGKHLRPHLCSTSMMPPEMADQDGLFFPDLLTNGRLIVSRSEIDGDVRTFFLAPADGQPIEGLKSAIVSFDTVSSPMPLRCVFENSSGKQMIELSGFVDVGEFSLPTEGRPYIWNAESGEWENHYWAGYEYKPEEVLPNEFERLYLTFYGIAEPEDPVGKVAEFGRKSWIPTGLGVGSVLVFGMFCLWGFWKRNNENSE